MNDIVLKNRKVHLISLGCARNRVDSEVMLGNMVEAGWVITDEPETADAIVINTCSFINSAKTESVDTILEAADLKQDNPNMKLVVTGCLPQRYKEQLEEQMPEVDLFLGTDEFPKIAELLDSPDSKKVYADRTNYLYNSEMARVNTLSSTSAYVKIAEGCQHLCSFCVIPAIRGKLRSRPVESIVSEVKHLTESGILEVNLIAQDLAAFGRDTKEDDLFSLLKGLVKIEKLKWLRCLYIYPENISDEFLEFFASEPKIVKYLDIPVQHANDRILKKMNRNITKAGLETILNKVRSAVPDVAIRTSIMTGFPGETHEEFLELKEFVEQQRFEHLGCFTYSQEEGTKAGEMKDQIDEETKQERCDEIMQLQQKISGDILKSRVNQTLDVLVEGVSDETELLMQGRLSIQAPEVDGVVFINDGPVEVGKIQKVKITESHDYDLVGHITE